MNCFNHQDRPALGLCKSCGKGICQECLAEVPDGLACKNKCEDRVNMINRVIDSNKKVLAAASVQIKSGTSLILVMGVVFTAAGFIPWMISGETGSIVIGVMGVVFLLSGLFRLRPKAQYPKL